jgi:hypothetical protein
LASGFRLARIRRAAISSSGSDCRRQPQFLATASASNGFQRPTTRLFSKPAIVFNQPNPSSIFLRHF